MSLGTVCDRCRGRLVVYRGHNRAEPCPSCTSPDARARRASAQHETVERLRSCWPRFAAGEASAFQLESATRACLAAGLSPDQLHRRTGIPVAQAKLIAEGQGVML